MRLTFTRIRGWSAIESLKRELTPLQLMEHSSFTNEKGSRQASISTADPTENEPRRQSPLHHIMNFATQHLR